MLRVGRRAVVAAIVLAAGARIFAGCVAAANVASPAAVPGTRAAAVGPQTTIPFGWIDFCRRYKGECDADPTPGPDIQATAANLAIIAQVNDLVNRSVEPVNDIDHWGVADQWDYPTDGKGDCEDYALLKRKLLREHGFPSRTLLITVVRDSQGEGHAILTVKTTGGDYVLDNLSSQVRLWSDAGYRFVKRQSQGNPNRWVALGDPRPTVATATSSR
jgi:predicted transglutaminase-like cysteine proteinase